MYVQLMRRQGNIQRAVKYVWLPCRLEHIFREDGRLDEPMLLHMLPPGWLPAAPEEILLAVAHPRGSTGLKGLTSFRSWGRHFDCYVLELWHEEPHR